MKHTEGKVKLEYDNYRNGSYSEWFNVINLDNTETIAQVGRRRKMTEKDQANAQRIVDCVNGCAGIKNPLAVEELLGVCKEILETPNMEISWKAFDKLKQAINKVERG